MKKIILGLMAVSLSLSVMAQTTDNASGKDKTGGKEFKQRHGEGKDNLEKLNLTEAQKQQIKTINESFRQQVKDLQSQGSITVDEQKQKRQALMKEHREKIEAVLTPEQKKQAESMAMDYRGGRNGGADRFENLTKDLNLSPEQSAKMSAINSTFKTNLDKIRQNASLTADEKRDQMKNLMKQHRSDMEALLTSDQKEQLRNRNKNRSKNDVVK